MIEKEKELISISKPRRTYTELVEKTEKIPVPPIDKFMVKKKSSGELLLIKTQTIRSRPLMVKVKQIERVKSSAICYTCDQRIPKGTPHKTAQIVIIDRENKTSKTCHVPLHLNCEFEPKIKSTE